MKTPSKMLRKIRGELKTKTLSDLAREYGYRSPSTIHAWLKSGTIPRNALAKLRHYYGET